MGIEGISHITFIARDLERTSKLLCEGLGATEVYDSAKKNFSISREKFFTLGGVWLAVMEGKPVERSYRHIAFKVDAADLPQLEARLKSLGAEVQPSRPRVDGEGQSLYFHDFDNNLFELHTGTLEQRLKTYEPTYQVRPFEERDRQALAAIYRESRCEAAWLPKEAKESDFARDTQGEVLFVAVGIDDEPQGFVSVWQTGAFIHHLYVRNGSRQKGIGTLLLESLRTRLPEPWTLKCVRANDAALAFYLRRGWREISSGVGDEGPYALLERSSR